MSVFQIRHGVEPRLRRVVLQEPLSLHDGLLGVDDVANVPRGQLAVLHDGLCEDLFRLHQGQPGQMAHERRPFVGREVDLDGPADAHVPQDPGEEALELLATGTRELAGGSPLQLRGELQVV